MFLAIVGAAHGAGMTRPSRYCLPSNTPCWPTTRVLEAFNSSLTGSASYLNYLDEGKLALASFCELVPDAQNQTSRIEKNGTWVNGDGCAKAIDASRKLAEERNEFLASTMTLHAATYTVPGIYVTVRSVEDVIKCVEFAVAHNIKLVTRTTSHDFVGGRSSVTGALVVNMFYLNHVSVDPETKTAVVGGGVTVGGAAKEVNQFGLNVASTGHDPSVGLVGCWMGGCHGVLQRKHGLGAEHIVAARVVQVDKNGNVVLVNASETENQDLLVALRGGGAGPFGVVVELTIDLIPAEGKYYELSCSFQQNMLASPTACQKLLQIAGTNKSARLDAMNNRVECKYSEDFLRKTHLNITWHKTLPEELALYIVSFGWAMGVVTASESRFKEIMESEEIKPFNCQVANVYETQYEFNVGVADPLNYEMESPALSADLVQPQDVIHRPDVVREILEHNKNAFKLYTYPKTRKNKVQTSLGRGMKNALFQIVIEDTKWTSLLEYTYLNEFHQQGTENNLLDWRRRLYGGKYNFLARIKQKFDPCNIFNVYKGVGFGRQRHCSRLQVR